MQQSIPMISLIIVFLPLMLQVEGLPLINENNVELRVSVKFDKRTGTFGRRVEISPSAEDLDALNEFHNNVISEEDSTFRIFIPTNNDRFDSWGG